MRITLVSPRIAVQKGDFLGSGIPYWPLEPAILAAFLRERSHEVSVIDLFGSSPTTLEDKGDYYLQGRSFLSYIDSPEIKSTELFILYALSYMSFDELLNISMSLKQRRPDASIAVLENSQAVTAYAIDQTADRFFDSGVDALICGEIYWNWDEIREFFFAANNELVPENVLVKNPPEGFALRRKINMHPSYPVPAWDLFELENYWSLPYSHGPKTKRFLPLLTSRGCPYQCDFCVVPGTNIRRWRYRTPNEVVDEIIDLRDRFSVRHFQIEDLNPTVRGSRWEEICRLLIEKDAGVYFYFVSGTKAETIKLEHVSMYARAGCRYISISPESGSSNVLKAIGKPFDHGHALSLVEECRRKGIYTQACFLVGHPSETERDHRLSCDYLRTLVRAGLDEVAVFVVAPFAGSKLYAREEVDIDTSKALISFSPKGRADWETVLRRRRELIWIYFSERLKKGLGLFLQLFRSLFGTPRTKMENLPRRIIFVYWLVIKYRLKRMITLG